MAEQPPRPKPEEVDGGKESRYRELREIFVATTGVEGFTETQDQRTSSRMIAGEDSVAEAVTAIAKADGLTDTYSIPAYEPDE